jgi:dihydrofolate synthase/folylpolyglutamate synthase
LVKQHHLADYHKFHGALKELIGPVQFSADINLKLERIAHLLRLIGDPQNTFPSIHVGGTSGKGSTAIFASEILTREGYKTGLHTSPHLQVINERFQINNQIAPPKVLTKIYKDMRPVIAEVARENPFGRPSYFEVQVAIAFCLFAEENVDVAVVEVGLGGALDATNVLDASIAVLTNVGLDHTEVLGDTVELIAKDKVGIIKPGQIVISGFSQPSTQAIVSNRCESVGATLWQHGEHFTVKNGDDDQSFSVALPGRKYQGLKVDQIGNFQVFNAGFAVAAVHAFNPNITLEVVQQGLKGTKIPGRMEIVQDNPTVILDGAHNPDKIRAASAAISKHFPEAKPILVFALKDGKDLHEIIPYAAARASSLIITSFTTELWNPVDPGVIAEAARDTNPTLEIIIQPDPIMAVELALKKSKPEDLVWITGSFYLIGNVRNFWYPMETLFHNIA